MNQAKRTIPVKKLCIIQIAGLSQELTARYADIFTPLGLDFRPLTPCFPAVTCTAQATFRTGRSPAGHGVVCNGVYSRDQSRVDFWNQSAHLMPETRIWDDFRRRGGTVGTVCWQQSVGDSVDLLLSPGPVHKHHGGLIQAFYSKPEGLYENLCRKIGRKFNLFRYWGPTTGLSATRWIAEASAEILRNPHLRTDVLLTYVPHLDYILQKQGPADSPKLKKAVAATVCELRKICDAAEEAGYELLLWGDYAITKAEQPVYPNRLLLDAGLFNTRTIRGMLYPDLFSSRAFAMADHQVAHVYVRNPQDVDAARCALTGQPGIAEIRPRETMDHERAGELILVAREGAWFAYGWWNHVRQAPDYAAHVDIHSKIGFDPCELFWGKLLPPAISLDATRVKGTHGLLHPPATWASTAKQLAPADSGEPLTLAALATEVKGFLSEPCPATKAD